MKGNIAKNCVFNTLQKIFPQSFMDGKELRINLIEGGENVQLKVSCTLSKTPIEVSNDVLNSGPVVISETFNITNEEILAAKELVKALGIEV